MATKKLWLTALSTFTVAITSIIIYLETKVPKNYTDQDTSILLLNMLRTKNPDLQDQVQEFTRRNIGEVLTSLEGTYFRVLTLNYQSGDGTHTIEITKLNRELVILRDGEQFSLPGDQTFAQFLGDGLGSLDFVFGSNLGCNGFEALATVDASLRDGYSEVVIGTKEITGSIANSSFWISPSTGELTDFQIVTTDGEIFTLAGMSEIPHDYQRPIYDLASRLTYGEEAICHLPELDLTNGQKVN